MLMRSMECGAAWSIQSALTWTMVSTIAPPRIVRGPQWPHVLSPSSQHSHRPCQHNALCSIRNGDKYFTAPSFPKIHGCIQNFYWLELHWLTVNIVRWFHCCVLKNFKVNMQAADWKQLDERYRNIWPPCPRPRSCCKWGVSQGLMEVSSRVLSWRWWTVCPWSSWPTWPVSSPTSRWLVSTPAGRSSWSLSRRTPTVALCPSSWMCLPPRWLNSKLVSLYFCCINK